ncbi:hypothetical protein BCV70DRAFT_200600 [Testicularia cyperi]|uniref:TPPC8 first Ig-like domain-containing protein n=1 Tax=Testicularia cyperi TaxID=1882483 RepID=A0A317XMX1_9BASI|nr:hypothetical protein BCV70DRAFT_200600 [Testicularia cyperi]
MSDLRIHSALSPRVAILSSPDVDRVTQLNGIPDLSTLLRPFEFSVERLSVRTSQLETRVCDRFPLRFDPYSLFNPQVSLAASSSSNSNLSSLQAAAGVPRPSSIARSPEDVLDLVNQLIASNIKTWDAKVPRPTLHGDEDTDSNAPLNGEQTISSKEKSSNDDDDDDDDDDDAEFTGKSPKVPSSIAELARQSTEKLTPWFAAVQNLVLRQRPITKHETFGHPVSVLIAVSSASPDPMNDFARLYEIASSSNPFPSLPYVDPDTLKYYVLIHDVRTSGADLSSSMDILEQVKKTYGLHCCLLPINSASDDRQTPGPAIAGMWDEWLGSPSPISPNPASPVPGRGGSGQTAQIGAFIDAEDVKRIKGFVRELTAQSIVPFMERYVQHMSEHLANSRKGLTNRLFGASKKLFGGVGGAQTKSSGSGTLSISGGYNTQYDFYVYSSIEAQTRRLADFAFTIRDYRLAASMYDMGRKDFSGDRAFRHAAGATEMFGLSHLLIMYTSRSPPIDVDSYLAQACHEYGLRSGASGDASSAAGGSGNSGTPTPLPDNSPLRATLLYYEAYRMLNYLRPAPTGLLRMAQVSDEVLSPLLLEQAAIACLQLRPRPSLRKYALYNVMAAHRYQACGQKILSLRCYAQAAAVYRSKGWTLVENHIEHELGTQAYNDGDSNLAVHHLLKLIRPSANANSEHAAFLSALQTAHKYSDHQGGDDANGATSVVKTELKLTYPLFDVTRSTLRFIPQSSASATSLIDDTTWSRLEEDLIERGLEDRVLADGTKQKRKRPTASTSTQAREVPVHQTFWLDLVAMNPLTVELVLSNIRPIFSRTDTSGKMDEAARDHTLSDGDLEVEDPGRIILAPGEERIVRVPIKIKVEAPALRVSRLTFLLADTIPLVQALEKKGQRLSKTKDERINATYAPDLSLAVSVHGLRPTLTAQILDAPASCYLGETRRLAVVLKNEGQTDINDLRALCNAPEAATFEGDDDSTAAGLANVDVATDPKAQSVRTVQNDLVPSKPESLVDPMTQASLGPGEQIQVQLTLHPVRAGPTALAWLLSFSSPDGETYLSRLALVTHVEPIMDVFVQCRPCKDTTSCDYELTVEATNLSPKQKVKIDALSVLSPGWTLSADLPGLSGAAVSILPLQVWRQSLRISRLLHGDPTDTNKDPYEHTALKLQDLLLSRDVKRDAPHPIDLTQSMVAFGSGSSVSDLPGPLIRNARRCWRTTNLAVEFSSIAARDRVKTFILYQPDELDVGVRFSLPALAVKDGERPRKGQVDVYGLQAGPTRNRISSITHPSGSESGGVRSMYAETAKELASLLTSVLASRLAVDQNPVVTAVARVQTGPDGKVDVDRFDVSVRNFSDVYTAEVAIELLEDTDVGSIDGRGEAIRPLSAWIGRRTLRCRLAPGANTVLHARRKSDGKRTSRSARYVVGVTCCLTSVISDGTDDVERGRAVARFVEQH